MSDNTDRVDYYRDRVKPRKKEIRAWLEAGLSNKQIAANLGIGSSTMDRFIKEHPKFKEFMKRSRVDSCPLIESAMKNNALGYDYIERTEERKYNEHTGKYEMVTTKTVLKHKPGSFQAQQYYLQQRNPERWKKDVEIKLDSGDINNNILSLANLLNNPAEVREIGSEE